MALVKFGSAVSAERTTLSDWRKLIIEASKHVDPDSVRTAAEFDIDKDNFLYVRARAVSAGEHHGPNDNGDFFPEAELEKFHKTFVRRGVYVNHKSDDPATAIGIILDAVWHGDKRKYVECLLAIDRSEPIARKIESGIAHSWSMGALVKECDCSLCGKTATSEAEYCDHLRTAMGKEWNGRRIYAVNRGLNFYELSNVTVPADQNAYTLQVLAESKQDLRKELLALADSYAAKVADAAERAAKQAVVGEVRRRIGKDPTPRSDRQILGTVRHRLKAATAPLLPREDKVVRRASVLGTAADRPESQNERIAETTPLEGINVMENLTIRYLPGETLKDCYFVARRGNLQLVKCAADLLDPATQKKIEAAEKADLVKDDSKPTPDNDHELGKEPYQPHDVSDAVAAKPGKEMKDDSKPSPDNKWKPGDEPAQPSDVVKRYAQMLGAKSVTFKAGENGSFTAVLAGGSIGKLSGMWAVAPRLMRQAKVSDKPMGYAREYARGDGTDPRDKGQMAWARESVKYPGGPDGATGAGAESKSYFQQYNTKDLPAGGESQWARKVNDLTRVASKFEADNKALKAENDILRKTVEAQKQAATEERKSVVVAKIIEYMEKAGALRSDANEVLDLKEAQGLNHEDAETKAYINARDRKRAELKALDVKALEAMLSNLSELTPAIQVKTASRRDLELPSQGRDERQLADEDVLSRGWN